MVQGLRPLRPRLQKGVLAIGTERSKGGYLMPYAQTPEKCIACHMCERTCPDVCIEVFKE